MSLLRTFTITWFLYNRNGPYKETYCKYTAIHSLKYLVYNLGGHFQIFVAPLHPWSSPQPIYGKYGKYGKPYLSLRKIRKITENYGKYGKVRKVFWDHTKMFWHRNTLLQGGVQLIKKLEPFWSTDQRLIVCIYHIIQANNASSLQWNTRYQLVTTTTLNPHHSPVSCWSWMRNHFILAIAVPLAYMSKRRTLV